MQTKILIADDEGVIRTIVERALRHESYRLLQAKDGDETVELARLEKPDLILLDINMPKKTGHQVLHELRTNLETQMIPVIMLTGSAGVMDKIQGLEMGADDYITKPFDLLELRARISSVLRRYVQDISANPLTKLPGSPAVEAEVNRRLRESSPFSFFHIDIDHFKSFNDAYGYANGDDALLDTAGTVVRVLKTHGSSGDFVGHIGGDDFIVITHPERAELVAAEIAASFDARSISFYKLEDRAKGHITVPDRQGHLRQFPLMTLSISITDNDKRSPIHYAQIVERVTELKRHLKMRGGFSSSAYLRDRRIDSCAKG